MRKPPFAFFLLTLAYVVSGRLGLMLAVAPGYATATFPPAGIAVAAMLIAGRATLPWTFLGSFLLNLWTGYGVMQRLDPNVVAAASVIAVASTVQAALAGGAMRRWLGVPTPLDNSRDLARFLVLSPLCCMTSATLSLSGLSVLGVIDPSALVASWVTWWIGDTLAVLLVLPLMLVLAGEPRALWRRRTLPVAAPMLLFAALFVAIFAWSTTLGSEQALLESWGMLAAGVFCTGLLGALLMLGTGQAHRAERLVEERTRDLKASNERLRIAFEERRQTEEALRQAQKMEAVGLLTGGVAHDFNNLLTVMVGNLDLLEPKVADRPDLGPLVTAMQHAAKRGEHLIAQLLAFSRQQTLRPETLDINGLIRRFEPLIRSAVGKNIEVETHLSPELWPCTIDAVQLETALLNLATNARDAMPAGGRLTITTQNLDRLPQPPAETSDAKPGPHVAIAFKDTGTGMPPELIERVFEPFVTTKEAGKGSGLGLSQVYGFVKQSGGHVAIDSEVGRGTTVWLYLPAADTAAASARVSQARSDTKPARGWERILIVEDDADVLGTDTAMMTDLGYAVRTAAEPLEALEILRDANEPIDLLFSDVMMPQMSGVELAAEAQKLRPGLKVLLTSGYGTESLSPRWAIGELPLIAKPYKQATLATRLRVLLDAR
jgi:signal transduction histidine kinase/CheY-like chemotaxis protein